MPPIARACPSLICPDWTACWTCGDSSRRRSVFVIVGSGAADSVRDLVVRQPELVDQSLERVRLFKRVQVGSLEVLDQRPRQLVRFGCGPNNCRDAIQAGDLRRSKATLAGDQPIARRRLGDEDRLQHAVLGDARRELLEGCLLDALAWLVWVAGDRADREIDRSCVRFLALGNERSESSAEPGLRSTDVCRHALTAICAWVFGLICR